MLLPLHLPHYLRSLGAYGRAGRDFIRSMLFFGFYSMLCVCVCACVCVCVCARARVAVVMHVCFSIFFSPCYAHSMHIAVFLLAHPTACVHKMSSPHPLK